ncbi:hypothetical protein K5D34_18005 [Pseudomonas cichorii]|uniref:Azurin n=1 Tax=Pseudomonas lijiangensis TaxID=2995658 RepID=A0ABX8HPE2_9PSED|nr:MULTISPECIES: hypothetical protein [Pseudomonas syringae group]MBX8492338.1 hypothetical protein [Pseudomonas cichorii]MBX8501509.1 hypothetical protein [Pseudomonas lijiangensis]MBX8506271.1 hypothetical protein [Pseudomonas lijiangensis]MBX8511581.1 hypothetical protein [Pseudomonas cichorii]MBX8519938.1 hypothetical protein [Pseudomonas cichorii]
MKFQSFKLPLTAAALALSLSPLASMAAVIEVTMQNNTPKTLTLVSSTSGFPSTLTPFQTVTFIAPSGFSSSDVQADYASGQSTGGCRFQAGHKEYSTGPQYTSSAKGYGQLSDGACYEYVSKKWSAPYNYKIHFMMSQ